MIHFTHKRKLWYVISLILIIPGIISMLFQGFNLGIDFTGGSIVGINFSQPVDPGELRETVSSFVEQTPSIQATSEQSYNIRTMLMAEEDTQAMVTALEERFGSLEVENSELIGPAVGKELVRNAQLALVLALALMLVYIAFRFKLNYAIAAIMGLCHDALVVLGFFSIFQIEVDGTFIAAILTVVGYSINNTIVVFDRIRENMQKARSGKENIEEIINASITQTLTRCINTVLAVLFLLIALMLFGGETTRVFALALILGSLIGFYSSLTLVGSFLLDIVKFRERPRQKPALEGGKK